MTAAEWLASLDTTDIREFLEQAKAEDQQKELTICRECNGSGWVYTVAPDGEGYVKEWCECLPDAPCAICRETDELASPGRPLEPVPPACLPTHRDDQPDPGWVRATCPECGGPVVSNAYYKGGRGYVLVWQCWNSLTCAERPVASCSYRRIL